MPSITVARPLEDEYSPYFGKYIALLPDEDILYLLETQMRATVALLAEVAEEQAEHRYAAGKWSVKEVVGHLSDTERVMSYRALRIARGDATPLPGFDENAYVAQADFGARTLQELVAELEGIRRATLLLLRGLPEQAWARRGRANDTEVSVRAVAYIIAGHELHHRQILVSRYGVPRREPAL
jgi:hypothetical protein